MKIHTVIIEFAMRYGIKEALILSELCRRAFTTGTMIIQFPVSLGKTYFPYMTVKQVRLSLLNLKAKGAILSISPKKQTIDRSCHYEIQEIVYHQFLQVIMAQQFFSDEGANLSKREE